MTHAANDALTVDWARTLRIDAMPSEALQTRLAAALGRDGVCVRFAGASGHARTYALVEGPQSVDPAELQTEVPEGRWYAQAVIALAIEPAPADALPLLVQALGGPGAPAGVLSCESAGGRAIVEVDPSVTQPALLLRIADVELRRFNGTRRIELLAPLPLDVLAQIAAEGLQAPEIASDRVLEALLEIEHVE